MSQEVNFGREKLTLLRLELKTMMSSKYDQDLQHLIPVDSLHQLLEKVRGSCETEWHSVVLEQTSESCLVAINWVDFYLVVRRGQIHG